MAPRLNILVLEDDPADTELMLRELRRAGFEPDWLRVDNEKEYLSHLHADLDLILSDFQMPEFNGLRALELLKERGFDIPFILISGTIGEDIAVQAMKLGAADYLLKDRLTRLGSAIQHALEQSRLRKERKAAMETLRLRETALNAVSQGVLISDENRLIIYTNASFTKLSGYAESEILGRNCSILQGPDTDRATIRKLRAALNAGEAFEGEILNYRKDGSPFWNELSIAPLRGEEGGPLRFIGIQRDVTERKQADEHLAASEALLRQFIEHTPAAIAMLDTQMRYLQVSKRWVEDYHLDGRNIIGKSHYEIFPDIPQHWKGIHQRALAGAVDRCDEAEYPRADGSTEWLQWEVRPWFRPGGEVGGLLIFTQVITVRKLAEEAMRRQETELRVLFDLVPAMIWFKDTENCFLRVNQRVAEATGKAIEEIEGKSAYEIFPQEASGYYADDLEVIHSATAKMGIIEKLRGPTGQELWVQTDKVPVLAKDGSVIGLIAMVQDITERKRAETALRESELRYHSLFENMVEGYAFCQLLYDEEGQARDFVYLEVNGAFESLSGLRDVVGKKISELVPGIGESTPELFEIYSRVALTSKTERFETHLPALGWFAVTVYSSKKEHFVAVFDNITARKQAEEALRQSEERFAGAFEEAPIGIAMISPEGRWLKVNRALCDTVGYSTADLLTRTFQEVTHPEDLAADLENVRRLIAGEIPSYQSEKRYIHAKGHFVPILLNVSLVRDAHGQPHYFIAQIQDITERKRSEARLRRLVDSNAQGVFFWNTKGEITVANDAFLKITGHSREDLEAGRINWVAMTPPEYAHLDRQALDELAASGVCSSYEKEWIRKDGSRVPILLGAAMFEDTPDDGVCFVLDITNRKQAEDDLRESQHFAQSIAENSTSVIYLYDLKTRGTLYTNRNGAEALGYSKAQILELGENFMPTLLHPEDLPKILHQSASFKDAPDDRVLDLEIRLKHASGEWRWFWTRETIFNRQPDGTPWQIMGTAQDITERKLAEEKLSEALVQEKELSEKARAGDHAKGEFLAVMSHEIRTPLNGILGFSELLARTPDLPVESRDYVETIISSGESLLRILNDILDYSRLDAGQVQIEKASFAPREILCDIRALLSQQAGDKELVLGVSIDESIPQKLVGDAGRLRQILLNLTTNAIKFTEEGCVTLGLRRMAGASDYEFFVKDTGCGISSGQVEHLFQPFTQADSSISRRHGGSGLGLSISRGLAELLGGTLTVRSQPGQGAEFILAVKLSEAEPVGDGVESISPPTLDSSFAAEHPLRIIIVEDDKVNLKLMLNLVRRLGYEPIFAKNGSEAVEKRKGQSPDCMLMDLQMPGMDGIEATERIRAWEKISRPDSPVFISALTANIVPADRQRCFEAGMNNYLNKPVKLAALAALLAEAENFVAIRN